MEDKHMASKQHMVAYNPTTKLYLRKKKKMWFTTDDPSLATVCPDAQIRQALRCVGGSFDGGWMLISHSDLNKLIAHQQKMQESAPAMPSVGKRNQVAKTSMKTPQTEGSEKIIEAVKALEDFVSSERIAELSKHQSEADKAICDMYHYIETTNLNASQGYKAYKKLQSMLINRRSIKNEMMLINRIKQSGIADGSYMSSLAQRSWESQVDVMSEEEGVHA